MALLGVLIGWVGASRAYAVGVHTLFRDHLPAVAIVAVLAGIAGVIVGRTIVSNREPWIAIAVVLGTYLSAALLITLAIDEMRRFPDIPRAVLAESAGGLHIAVLVSGLVVGRLTSRSSKAPSPERSPVADPVDADRGPSPP